ncbi:peptidyl-prolyl cis-trans isomerase [Aureococcus anophagefferens]|nr:peptidyl-prolyl cis-trans isomerase [Aureococcus anophagefferens]
MAPLDMDAPAWKVRRVAASKIQAVVRLKSGANRLLAVARSVYEVGYDAESEDYFYYNKMTGESHWDLPIVLRAMPPYRNDRAAVGKATTIQAVFRAKLARRRVNALMPEIYRKDFDPDSGEYYYTNTVTKELGPDSALIVSRDEEIKALKARLEEKEAEIEEVKQGTYEQLGKEVRLKRMADALKGQKRAKNFDEWRNEHVVAWFLELDLEEHVPSLLASKVDGLLLLNMDEDDFKELGITKRLHQRRIDDDDVEDDMDDDESQGASSSSSSSSENDDLGPEVLAADDVDEDDLLPTEEELLELKQDRDNVQIEVLFPGDEETYPQIGDVVRCHYVCKLHDGGKEIENTRKSKRTFEFVLGIGQVIRGWDRGVLQMSFGERSKLTISPEYGYGSDGAEAKAVSEDGDDDDDDDFEDYADDDETKTQFT